MIVRRPGAPRLLETVDEELVLDVGVAHSVAYPDEFYTEEELREWRKEQRRRQHRRRPVGFAPWPEND